MTQATRPQIRGKKKRIATIYWVIVEARFTEPPSETESDFPGATGFLQIFGCTADSTDAMKAAVSASLFSTDWLYDALPVFDYGIAIIDPEDVEEEIFEDAEVADCLSGSPYERGLWYASGRDYFRGDDDGADGHLNDITLNSVLH